MSRPARPGERRHGGDGGAKSPRMGSGAGADGRPARTWLRRYRFMLNALLDYFTADSKKMKRAVEQ
jgi:hypothetical protein